MNAKNYWLPLALALGMSSVVWADNNPFKFDNNTPAPAANTPTLQAQSMQIYNLADGRYHAELSYTDQHNANQQFVFEGTPEDIQQALQANKNLPEAQKQALLHSLNMGSNGGNLAQQLQQLGSSFFNGQDPFSDPTVKNMLGNSGADLEKLLQGLPALDSFDDQTLQQFMQQAQGFLQNAPALIDPDNQITIPAQPPSAVLPEQPAAPTKSSDDAIVL